ncbi:MAG TPA: cupin domain-containing protein [Pyrinomonadaceae bacterium]|jgi:mannose-6-phosphate isomerase-like protein (cupin superfamily)|nr:cupin domain-containing protein [Pyrinomonadaceae bacterium]
MAVNLEGGCRVSEMREGESFTEGSLRIWNRVGRATGAQAISLRILEFAPGLSPAIRNQDCDELLYVVDIRTAGGDGSVNLSIDGQSFVVGPDTGIYIRPGQTFSVDNSGPCSVVFVSSQCPDPNRSPQFVTSPATASHDLRLQHRPPIVRLEDRPAQSTADRWYRVLVDDEIGSTQVTQFVGSIPPGRAPNHFHNYEEVLFILKGKGRMWAGETHTPIAPGSCIYLPKGQVHCVENTGEDELRLLGVFYPAGSPSVSYDV